MVNQDLITCMFRVKNVNVLTDCKLANINVPDDKTVLLQEPVDICRVRELVKDIELELISVLLFHADTELVDT
jgi:hypothetical protein